MLSIDQGTSGTKALVVNANGTVLSSCTFPVRPSYLPGGGVEQDPHELLNSVIESGRRAVAQAGAVIDMVTVANQGETVLAWDPETGTPLSNMVVWQDRRAEAICRALVEHEDLLAERTGLVLDPYFSAPKQAWIRRHVTRDGVVTTSDSWLLHQLTGRFVTDASTASRSLVTDLDTGAWDPQLLALFGLAEERLPTIVDCDEVIGETAAFGGVLPVGGLVVDQQAALLAENCLAAGEAKCTFGTGAFLLANTGGTAVRSASGLTSSVAWVDHGTTTYCLDGQVYTAASAVRWLQQLGFIGSAADLDHVAAPDAAGVLAVPALAGLAAPWWQPEAAATFTGMRLSTGRGELVLAVLEGIAAQVAALASCMSADLGEPLRRLRVDGGLTQSRVLMQSVANLLQIDVDVYPSQHATPLGAAALARVAANPQLALSDAVVAWTPSTTYAPHWSADHAAEFLHHWNAVASPQPRRATS